MGHCYARTSTNNLYECADGTTSTDHRTCQMDRGSNIVRCPNGQMACDDVTSTTPYKDFRCSYDCSKYGGIKDCHLDEGIIPQ